MSGRAPGGSPPPNELMAVLEEARDLGLLGPGPLEPQRVHSSNLAAAIGPFGGRFLDLGSGSGLPGLVLAAAWPTATGVLLDAQRRRCEFLSRAVARLGLDARLRVVCGRAEALARSDALRGQFDLVVARSFGAPSTTAECAVGFLRPGGALVVTEPPEDAMPTSRWDPAGMQKLGFGEIEAIRRTKTGAMRAVLERGPDDRWPRRDGVPAKRPLW